MSLLSKALSARNALNYGEKLADSATYKTQAATVNAVVGLLTALTPFVSALVEIDPNVLHDAYLNLGLGVYGGVCVYNWFMHVATSDSVGFGKRLDQSTKK